MPRLNNHQRRKKRKIRNQARKSRARLNQLLYERMQELSQDQALIDKIDKELLKSKDLDKYMTKAWDISQDEKEV